MNIYVMRHGQTVWNEKGITQGRSRNRLSKQGIKATQEAAEKVKNIPFDVIFSSPMVRSVQTANIVNQYHKVKVVKDAELIEIDQGIFTARKKNSLSEQEKRIRSARSKEAGMESCEECYERMKSFLERLKKCDYKNVLIVTHYHPAAFIEDIVTGKEKDFSEVKQKYEYSQIKKFVLSKN